MDTSKVVLALSELKEGVIGLFKRDGRFYMVTEFNRETDKLNVMHISDLGGVSQEYGTPTKFGRLCLFPDGKNMNQMLEDPFGFYEFTKLFDK